MTCKIRLLKTSHETVELARQIEKTGVSALAVHGRWFFPPLLLFPHLIDITISSVGQDHIVRNLGLRL